MIHFYEAKIKRTSIIAYGDTHIKERHFKITYEKPPSTAKYVSWKKIGAKYIVIGVSTTIESAKNVCQIRFSHKI